MHTRKWTIPPQWMDNFAISIRKVPVFRSNKDGITCFLRLLMWILSAPYFVFWYPIFLSMKMTYSLLILFIMVQATSTVAQDMRKVLADGLKSTHTETGWFVTLNTAVDGVTAEQAMWKDGSGNHSVGQLVYHLWFWNDRQLKKFKGEKLSEGPGDNNETFDKFDKKQWDKLVSDLKNVMTEMENWVLSTDDAALKQNAATLMNVTAHNAYHIGQIVFVRKLQKSWNPEKGVK